MHILEGRTVEQKRKMVDGVTKAICDSLTIRPEKVRTIISKMDNENFAVAGKLVVDG